MIINMNNKGQLPRQQSNNYENRFRYYKLLFDIELLIVYLTSRVYEYWSREYSSLSVQGCISLCRL